ncbi:hypothetical protein [Burkholderia sp. AU45388]|uniref:hypothetical protein n=1 Tax=Burkholderia sp. AU45388 TaxID=3059206 RepID=UPI0026523445|nr:hypothetical protein [Burkholderia sp. AU45388]MDN7431424.1 hypothetical protein [Burkholderia sp. AU45388]
MAATNSSAAPSYATVLDGLRHVCHRQVVRYRHGAPVEALARMGFIAWVRQPIRLSQQVAERSRLVPVPIEVAELTDTGRAALDWLVAFEATAHWETLHTRPYSTRDHQEAP